MEEPILVTDIGKQVLEEKIASLERLIARKEQEKRDSSTPQYPGDESLHIVYDLDREIESLQSILSSYEPTLKRIVVYDEIDEKEPITHVQLGTYVILRYLDGRVAKLYMSGLSDAKRTMGMYNFLGEPISLGRALLKGNVKEGDKVMGNIVLEVSHGNSTFQLEKDLTDSLNKYTNSIDIAKREGDDDTLRETRSQIDSKIDWIYDEMSLINHQYYDAIELMGLSRMPTLEKYADSNREQRIKIRTGLSPEHRHFLRSFVTLRRFLEEFQRL